MDYKKKYLKYKKKYLDLKQLGSGDVDHTPPPTKTYQVDYKKLWYNAILSGNKSFEDLDSLPYQFTVIDDRQMVESLMKFLYGRGNREIRFEIERNLNFNISITIPKSVKTIGEGVFSNCGISFLNFEDESQIETIGAGAFYDNYIKEINFPDSLKNIGELAFARNRLITVPQLPNVNIGELAFAEQIL